MIKNVIVGVLLGAVAAGVTACSSSSSPTHNTGSALSQRSSSRTQQRPGIPSSTPPTSTNGGGSASAFCTEVKKQAHILTLGNYDLAHVDRNAYKAELTRIVAVTPDVIKSDIQAIVAIQRDAINGHLDTTKLDSPTLVQHTRHLATWMQTNCPGVLGNPAG